MGLWEIEAIIVGIPELKKDFVACNLSAVRRNANKAADWVAQNRAPLLYSSAWIADPPKTLEDILYFDVCHQAV
ncbi:conserved hypothetical protein [Ricinus communis]|uniref:Uncharacterized protein n=1 Tax=Ricinus communis TaxID=3988 RepID=B9T295_RICCO|nr:conserved hypothetical protein [Ricinus communis]